jgi:glucose/arabinose dehydrogenase
MSAAWGLSRRLATLAVGLGALVAAAVELPPGFRAETLASALNAPTALALAPDGRIFIADQTGFIRVWQQGTVRPEPALDLSGRVDTWWERGLIGLALHPDFPRAPHAYVLYTAKAPHPHHVLSRFTLVGDQFDPASEVVLLEGDDQTRYGGNQPAGHQGGPLRFGPDGKLYVSIGEQTVGPLAQSLDALQGKILRLNPDGSIPADNPFVDRAAGKYRAAWALGLRNVFGLAFQPGTGRLFATDVGQTGWEEVNEIRRGANYGWPDVEGRGGREGFTDPVHAYPPLVGRSIVGAAFASRAAPALHPFPAEWQGRFFFADWAAHWIKTVDPDRPAVATTFARGLDHPVALEFDADGSLLVLNRGTIWRDGKAWRANSGSLLRIRSSGDAGPGAPDDVPAHPPTLAAIGLFRSLAPLVPRDDLIACHLNHPPWTPGLVGRTWLALPAGGALSIDADQEFEFPRGALVVQHFDIAHTGAPFETQLFRFSGPAARSRVAAAAVYRWSGDGTAATLVTEGTVAPLPGDPAHRWLSPAPEARLNLDSPAPGFVFPLSPRQLHRDLPDRTNQLVAWSRRGWISPRVTPPLLPQIPRLVPLDASEAPLELRVRSYLDVHCASCHRPGGAGRGEFDARFLAPTDARDFTRVKLLGAEFGPPGARLVVPGDPERSVLYLRLVRTDALRMPPTAVNDDPPPVLDPLAAWIRSLRP